MPLFPPSKTSPGLILGVVPFSQPRHVAHEQPTGASARGAHRSAFVSRRGARWALFPIVIVQSAADTAAAPLIAGDRATTAFVDSGYAVNRPASGTDSDGPGVFIQFLSCAAMPAGLYAGSLFQGPISAFVGTIGVGTKYEDVPFAENLASGTC
jgi:hypothetical protein